MGCKPIDTSINSNTKLLGTGKQVTDHGRYMRLAELSEYDVKMWNLHLPAVKLSTKPRPRRQLYLIRQQEMILFLFEISFQSFAPLKRLSWNTLNQGLFCGNLGNEVNEDVLSKALSRFPSFNMAKVVRNKLTGKTTGWGFVFFSKPSDLDAAFEEMNVPLICHLADALHGFI
ncbi:RNA-binding protein 42 [Capsicum chinense]|nr:RNA-binding protein 42 [Capsicum chinense]